MHEYSQRKTGIQHRIEPIFYGEITEKQPSTQIDHSESASHNKRLSKTTFHQDRAEPDKLILNCCNRPTKSANPSALLYCCPNSRRGIFFGRNHPFHTCRLRRLDTCPCFVNCTGANLAQCHMESLVRSITDLDLFLGTGSWWCLRICCPHCIRLIHG